MNVDKNDDGDDDFERRRFWKKTKQVAEPPRLLWPRVNEVHNIYYSVLPTGYNLAEMAILAVIVVVFAP
jgi:hypothetical protein